MAKEKIFDAQFILWLINGFLSSIVSSILIFIGNLDNASGTIIFFGIWILLNQINSGRWIHKNAKKITKPNN